MNNPAQRAAKSIHDFVYGDPDHYADVEMIQEWIEEEYASVMAELAVVREEAWRAGYELGWNHGVHDAHPQIILLSREQFDARKTESWQEWKEDKGGE